MDELVVTGDNRAPACGACIAFCPGMVFGQHVALAKGITWRSNRWNKCWTHEPSAGQKPFEMGSQEYCGS